jgi:hypothetical protein
MLAICTHLGSVELPLSTARISSEVLPARMPDFAVRRRFASVLNCGGPWLRRHYDTGFSRLSIFLAAHGQTTGKCGP